MSGFTELLVPAEEQGKSLVDDFVDLATTETSPVDAIKRNYPSATPAKNGK